MLSANQWVPFLLEQSVLQIKTHFSVGLLSKFLAKTPVSHPGGLKVFNTFSNSNVFITLQGKVDHNRSVLVNFDGIFKFSVHNNIHGLYPFFFEVHLD